MVLAEFRNSVYSCKSGSVCITNPSCGAVSLQGLEDYLLFLCQEELFSRYLFQLQKNPDSSPGESVGTILKVLTATELV